jgi:hypothetical protein
MNKLNHRHRKSLKFKTPHMVFFADTLQESACALGLHFGIESTSLFSKISRLNNARLHEWRGF